MSFDVKDFDDKNKTALDRVGDAWNGFIDLLDNTRIEIPIGVAVGAFMIGSASYYHETGKAGQIPVAFSEISQIEEDLAARGQDVPALTRYYASTNDAVMKVFEANNLCYEEDGCSNQELAEELRQKVDPDIAEHTTITEYADRIEDYARAAERTLRHISDSGDQVNTIRNTLERAWDYDRDDHETLSTCTRINMDGDLETYSCWEYDYSDHTYTFNDAQGRRAAGLLQQFVAEYPNIRLDGQFVTASRTNADNQSAMAQSRPYLEDLNDNDFMRLSATWATGSNFQSNLSKLYTAHAGVTSSANSWTNAANTAESESYKTYSRFDSGPDEYQVAQSALDFAASYARQVRKVLNGLDDTPEELRGLNEKIVQFIDLHEYGTPKGQARSQANQLRDEILSDARDIYEANFSGGFNTYTKSWGMIILSIVLGAAGGGIGFGADQLRANYSRRRRLGAN